MSPHIEIFMEFPHKVDKSNKVGQSIGLSQRRLFTCHVVYFDQSRSLNCRVLCVQLSRPQDGNVTV